jgi:hypothetical protein
MDVAGPSPRTTRKGVNSFQARFETRALSLFGTRDRACNQATCPVAEKRNSHVADVGLIRIYSGLFGLRILKL